MNFYKDLGSDILKRSLFIIVCLLTAAYCSADTFTNRKTGEVFHGYATGEKKGGKTLVRVGEKKSAEYLYLSDYDIEWNASGRRNEVVVLPIKNDIELECETEAFEKAIKNADNHGPLLIIIEIDTPGGRGDLMTRICEAISKAESSRTAAFISGGEYGGAYSAGAVIALACDYIFMANGTAIGAATPIIATESGIKDVKSFYGETVGEKFLSADRAYIAALAERKGRSGLLAKAMVDKDIQVLEVVEEGETILISPEDKKRSQKVERVWNKKGELLTLTSEEAAACRIADKLLNSKEEIISEFGFEKPKIVLDQETIKARRKFEAVQRKFDRIYEDIDYLRQDVDSLLSRYNSMVEYCDNEFEKLKNLVQKGRSNDRYVDAQKKLLEDAYERLEEIDAELSRSLQKLNSKYKSIYPLIKANPDLPIDVKWLEEEMNWIKVLRKDMK